MGVVAPSYMHDCCGMFSKLLKEINNLNLKRHVLCRYKSKIYVIIIIYHDFLPTPRRGSHVESGATHTVIKIHPLAHILDS